MYTVIGCFDAKTKLSALLQGVKQGKRYTITLRGYPIADLVPSEGTMGRQEVETAVERMRQMHKIQGVSAATVESWIEEGRQ